MKPINQKEADDRFDDVVKLLDKYNFRLNRTGDGMYELDHAWVRYSRELLSDNQYGVIAKSLEGLETDLVGLIKKLKELKCTT